MKTCTGMLLSLLVIGMLALSGCAGKPTLTPCTGYIAYPSGSE
jgi:hypothetical protein